MPRAYRCERRGRASARADCGASVDLPRAPPYDSAAMNLRELDEVDREFAAQDRRWNAPKFFGLGMMTLLVAIFVIVYAATRTGCTVAIVP